MVMGDTDSNGGGVYGPIGKGETRRMGTVVNLVVYGLAGIGFAYLILRALGVLCG